MAGAAVLYIYLQGMRVMTGGAVVEAVVETLDVVFMLRVSVVNIFGASPGFSAVKCRAGGVVVDVWQAQFFIDSVSWLTGNDFKYL